MGSPETKWRWFTQAESSGIISPRTPQSAIALKTEKEKSGRINYDFTRMAEVNILNTGNPINSVN